MVHGVCTKNHACMSYSVKETPWPMAVGQLRGLLLLSQNRASVLFGRPSFRKPQAEDERVPVVSANSCLYLDSLHTRFLPLSRVSFSSLLARSLSLSLLRDLHWSRKAQAEPEPSCFEGPGTQPG